MTYQPPSPPAESVRRWIHRTQDHQKGFWALHKIFFHLDGYCWPFVPKFNNSYNYIKQDIFAFNNTFLFNFNLSSLHSTPIFIQLH